MTLVGSETIPLQRFSLVLRHASALIVHEPEIDLGVGVTLIGQWAQKPESLRVIAFVVCGNSIL